MNRKLKIVLDNGGGELASAMRTVRCDTDGDVVDSDSVNEWAHQQIDIWTLSAGDTIRIEFAEPISSDDI